MNTLRAREIFNDDDHMLIAIESAVFLHRKTNSSYRYYGNIEPLVVIICSSTGSYVLGMDGKQITLEQLKKVIPDLDVIIGKFNLS